MTRRWISLLAIWPFAAQAQPGSFQGIGHLPGQAFESSATDISADGQVVVGSARQSGNLVAVRWTAASGLEALPVPAWGSPSWSWTAHGVSGDGSVIVGSAQAGLGGWSGDFAFRWTAATGIVDLGRLTGATTAGAVDVSQDGSVVVGASGPLGAAPAKAFRWTETGGMQQLLPHVFLNWAAAVSDDATTIVGTVGARGFRWTATGGMELISNDPEVWAYGVSGEGRVIVGRRDQGYPFRWVLGTGFAQGPAGLPGATSSSATSVSRDGEVVIGVSSFTTFRPFIWDTSRGTRPLRDALVREHGLDLTGWDLSAARISGDRAFIVGTGRNPCGQQEGWVARLGTSPACYADCTADSALTVADFACFLQRFAAGDPYANCDRSCAAPVLNVADFVCFMQQFAAGCR